MSEGLRKRSVFATFQQASSSSSSLGKKRWVDAVETVLSQSSIEIPSDSLVGKACSYVSSPTDSISEKNLKGILFLVGISCAISSLFLAIESYLITNSKWSLVFPVMVTVATSFLLMEFQTTKQLQPFFKGTLMLLFGLPLLIQLTVGHSFISCTFSLVSFFAPFCAILYDVNEAERWFQIGLGAHGFLVILELLTGSLTIYSFIDLFNLLALLTLVFYSIHYHVSGLNKAKAKLNLANSFLRNQKKELIGENEELTKEVEKLKNINHNEHFSIDHESQAEKIIAIMSNLKKSEASKDFSDDIDFVVKTVSAGKNIYLPDMKASLEGNIHLDSSMKSFLLSHNHHGIHYDPVHEKHMHVSELTNSGEKKRNYYSSL